MQKINLIQLPFYQWTLPDLLINQCVDFVKQLKYHTNQQTLSSDVFDYDPLTTYVNSSCKDLQNNLYPVPTEFTIFPTIFWANKTNFLGKHHRHRHDNSLYSGIIYLTENENSGATRFYFPDIFKYYEKSFFKFTDYQVKDNYFDFYPEKGKMIIFPSNIEHETIVNKKAERVTISFNTFIKGEIGSRDQKTFLKI